MRARVHQAERVERHGIAARQRGGTFGELVRAACLAGERPGACQVRKEVRAARVEANRPLQAFDRLRELRFLTRRYAGDEIHAGVLDALAGKRGGQASRPRPVAAVERRDRLVEARDLVVPHQGRAQAEQMRSTW
jgi:hypothetical protein